MSARACACVRAFERIGMGFATVTSDATGNDLLYVFGGVGPAAPSGLNDLFRCVQHACARVRMHVSAHVMAGHGMCACGVERGDSSGSVFRWTSESPIHDAVLGTLCRLSGRAQSCPGPEPVLVICADSVGCPSRLS
jgi:hypothetical protein